ncbi:uncharacterized protein MONOS_4247 [Monocercomonoides exilis]|uniref:uncharacterized protein n=1 Tax=Monocercomonoides exilis TaxID=2049356 RepID=UPI00355A5CA3|nr:hypothetical protein MONOS_4247 [Monocercomonoides exilis]|eukprot:MONOS_4247.1-p1 / transcript=MONOS_4247.1 / gene=MONOS_4247 / organism=Monocercomonoides_exilis_PA203 / gene_product=unspecified product / transcript_product=unspecified product / location=Mono_scaffold00110:98605-102768(+) / protein_length=1388 / sequence_SO=supercontig / SO=protein_coding / is_pseudo=false
MFNISINPPHISRSLHPMVADHSPDLEVFHEGSIYVECSKFTCFTLLTGPFLSSARTIHVTIGTSIFSNVTVNKRDNFAELNVHPSKTYVDGCLFVSVGDAIDGGIVKSIRAPSSSLHFQNSSFRICFRSEKANIEENGTKEIPKQMIEKVELPSGNHSFQWCEWKDLQKSTSEGGALFCYIEESNITISFCSFFNCSTSSNGGALYLQDLTVTNISNTNISQCLADNAAGGMFYESASSGTFILSGCFCSNCSINALVGTFATFVLDHHITGQFLFEKSYVSNNEGTNSMGAISFYWPSQTAILSVSDCFLIGNTIKGENSFGGAALTFSKIYSWMTDTKFITFSLFHKNIDEGDRGNDAIFLGDDFLISSPFLECYSTTSDKRVWFNESVDSAIYNNWLPFRILEKYVALNGSDSNEWCGFSEADPCRTIGCTVDKNYDVMNFVIKVLEGKHKDEIKTINVDAKNVSIIGKGKNLTVIGFGSLFMSNSSALFSASSGNLKVSFITIDYDSSRNDSPSMFVVSGGRGSIALDEVEISSSIGKEFAVSSSLFVMAFYQLSMNEVTIKNMNVSQPLFFQPRSSSEMGRLSVSRLTLDNITWSGIGSLIQINSANLEIKDSDICVDNLCTSYGYLLNVTKSVVTVSNCTFFCLRNPVNFMYNKEEQKEEHFSCRFEGSLIALTDCSSSFMNVKLINSSIGALSVIEGKIRLSNVSFIGNSLNLLGYSTVRRNVLCENGELEIDSYFDESGLRNPDKLPVGEFLQLWIQSNGCKIKGLIDWDLEEDSRSEEEFPTEFTQKIYLFCRPHISSSVRGENEDEILIRFIGENLLPCLVSYEVFSLDTTDSISEKQAVSLLFTKCTFTNQNEFSVNASISQFQSVFDMTKTQIWIRAVLKLNEYALSERHSTKDYVIKTEPILLLDIIKQHDGFNELPSKTFHWWIILVILGVLIIASIITVIIVVKKKRLKKLSISKIDDSAEEGNMMKNASEYSKDEYGNAVNTSETLSTGNYQQLYSQIGNSSNAENQDAANYQNGDMLTCQKENSEKFKKSDKVTRSELEFDGDMFKVIEPNNALAQNPVCIQHKRNSTEESSNSSTEVHLPDEIDSSIENVVNANVMDNFPFEHLDSTEASFHFNQFDKEETIKDINSSLQNEKTLPKNDSSSDLLDDLEETHSISHQSELQKDDKSNIQAFDIDESSFQQKGKKKWKKEKQKRRKELENQETTKKNETEAKEDAKIPETSESLQEIVDVNEIEALLRNKSPESVPASSSTAITSYSIYGDEIKAMEDLPVKFNDKDYEQTEFDCNTAENSIAFSSGKDASKELIEKAEKEQIEEKSIISDEELESLCAPSGKKERIQKKKKKKKKKSNKHQKLSEEESNLNFQRDVEM